MHRMNLIHGTKARRFCGCSKSQAWHKENQVNPMRSSKAVA